MGELERQAAQIDRAIVDTGGDLAAAKRDREVTQRLQGAARAGIDAFRAQADQRREAEIRKNASLQAFLDFKAEHGRKEQAERARNETRAKELARQRDVGKEKLQPKREPKRGPAMDR